MLRQRLPALSLRSAARRSETGVLLTRRKFLEPFEVRIERLGRNGVGVGTAPDGAPVNVRPAPPGSVVRVVPQGKRKGVWSGRRVELVERPAGYRSPVCPVFGLCGGCALQELDLEHQRSFKQAFALEELASVVAAGPVVHPIRGVDRAEGYRNRVEFSFGTRRYLSETDHQGGGAIEGRWLGFHAPGRFDRVVDTDTCALVGPASNQVLTEVRAHALHPDAPPPWDSRAHQGFWRHLLVRESRLGELLVGVFTAPGGDVEVGAVDRLATALMALRLDSAAVVGVVWVENGGVADVAQGAVRQIWGRDHLREQLGDVSFRLSLSSFFQTSTEGASILYDTIGEALGSASGGTLYDLYSGTGAIGQYLAQRFSRIVGIEENPAATSDAARNAEENGVAHAEYRAARVEDALEHLPREGTRCALVVDPPRVGLHPRVVSALAQASADVLVYVACHPASLGRDAVALQAGGWRPTDVWTVDLFPHTGHVEAVVRFVRSEA